MKINSKQVGILGNECTDYSEFVVDAKGNSKSLETELTIEKGASCTVLENVKNSVPENFSLSINVREGAKLNYIFFSSRINENRVARLKKNSEITFVEINSEGNDSNSELNIELECDNAKGNIYSLFFATGNQKKSVSHKVNHLSKSGTSNIVARGVLGDNAKVEYKSLIHVDKDSKNTIARQSEHSLLLSKNCSITATPGINVLNEDADCKHGAAISQIDNEYLFYMESRGMNAKSAKRQALISHIQPIIKFVPDSIRENLYSCIEKKF